MVDRCKKTKGGREVERNHGLTDLQKPRIPSGRGGEGNTVGCSMAQKTRNRLIEQGASDVEENRVRPSYYLLRRRFARTPIQGMRGKRNN